MSRPDLRQMEERPEPVDITQVLRPNLRLDLGRLAFHDLRHHLRNRRDRCRNRCHWIHYKMLPSLFLNPPHAPMIGITGCGVQHSWNPTASPRSSVQSYFGNWRIAAYSQATISTGPFAPSGPIFAQTP